MSLFYRLNTTEVFILSFIFGIILRAYFDFFRLIRKLRAKNQILTFIEDIVYTISSGALIFIFVFVVSDGVYRLLEFFGIFIGSITYHYTLSNVILRALYFIFLKIQQILTFLYKNSVIRIYIYLDKFYKKGKIIIEKNKKERFSKKLLSIFKNINERNDQNEQSAKNT